MDGRWTSGVRRAAMSDSMWAQDDSGGVCSHGDALRWTHSDEGAPIPSWCAAPAYGALRLAAMAAWVFWQDTRQHKEGLGGAEDEATPLPNPTGQTTD
jgi:hypothetical protein